MEAKLELKDILNGSINEKSKKYIDDINKKQRDSLVKLFNDEYLKVIIAMQPMSDYYNITTYFDVEFVSLDRVSYIVVGFYISHKSQDMRLDRKNTELFIPRLNAVFDFAFFKEDKYFVYNGYNTIFENDIVDIIRSKDSGNNDNLDNIDDNTREILNIIYYAYLKDLMKDKFGHDFFRDNIKFSPVINFNDEGRFSSLGVELTCLNTSDRVLAKFNDVLDLDRTPFEDKVTKIIYSI